MKREEQWIPVERGMKGPVTIPRAGGHAGGPMETTSRAGLGGLALSCLSCPAQRSLHSAPRRCPADGPGFPPGTWDEQGVAVCCTRRVLPLSQTCVRHVLCLLSFSCPHCRQEN